MALSPEAPRVFLSYSHDSLEHKAAVLTLANRLRTDGCNVTIDQDRHWIAEGWTVWMDNQIVQADFVLVVCSEIYTRRAEGKEPPPAGGGSSWEGAIIRRDLYETNGRNEKFIPITMKPADKVHRPRFLRDYPNFLVSDVDSYRSLCQVLHPKSSVPDEESDTWQIPLPNPYFSGREQYLEQLRKAFITNNQPVALTQAIKGLGGMGKTQTALKYAEMHRAEYVVGLRVVADSGDKLVSGFAEFVRKLGLPGKADSDIARVAATAKRWFDSNENWLLILDNVESWEIVRDWIPSNKRGHVLVTTRLQSSGKFATGLDLPKLGIEEGTRFLLARGKFETPTAADVSAARKIVEAFDGLPLGLEQAGAYMEEAPLSPEEYLDLYRTEGHKLRDRGSLSADHDTVTVTFSLAFAKLSEDAKQMVRQAAFLAPDAIPEELLAPEQKLDLAFRDATADAVRFSLLERDLLTKTISIHRVVQAVVKDSVDENDRRGWVERNVHQLNQRFPEKVEYANWAACERLLPQSLEIIAGDHFASFESADAASLLHRTGCYLLYRARYVEAEPLILRAITIRETALSSEHPDTASSLNDLGCLYKTQGRYQEAEPFLIRGLRIRESVLGLECSDTAMSLNNLACLYQAQGNHKEAEPLHRRALEIREKALGPDHPDTADDLNHPDTASSLNNLANLYQDQGMHKEAEPLYRRALEIKQNALGPDHPDTATGLNNLAGLYQDQGKHKEAEPLYRQAHEIQEKVLGPDHPDTATSLNNLGGLYEVQGMHQQAEPLYRRALEIREKALGLDHPDTATSLNNLAGLYKAQEMHQQAEPLYRRALEIREKALGPDHPDTATSLSNLAGLYLAQGRHMEAEQIFKRALEIRERVLGPEHPDTSASLNNLASFYARRGRLVQAEPLFRKALQLAERSLGVADPKVISIALNYAGVLQRVGRGHEAHKIRQRYAGSQSTVVTATGPKVKKRSS